MSELVVQPYSSGLRSRWDEFAVLSKNGTFLIQRDFMEYHSNRFADASTIVMDHEGRIKALFPASRSGERLSSHGGLSYGGMISDKTMTAPLALDVFTAWLNYCCREGVSEIIYKSVPTIYHQLPADEDRYAIFYHGGVLHRRDVTSVIDFKADAPIQERRRRGIKKALKAGLYFDEISDVAEFWTVLNQNLGSRHDKRPVHSLEELLLLRNRFPQNIQLFGVFESDVLRAGTLLFCCGSTIHAQYIASSEEGRAEGALDLLFSRVIDRFRENARYFDFGNSNENEGRYLNRGLIEFKEGFGARSIIQDFFRIDLDAWQSRVEINAD
jgi:hypothetical protein